MKGEVDILANFPIDTSLKKKTHSALMPMSDSAILSDNAEVDADIRIRMAIPNTN